MPKTISKEYDRYSNEFKRLAVVLTHHPDMLSIDIAEKLGIHPVMLYRWRMEMKNGDIPGKPASDEIDSEVDLIQANREIRRLSKELKDTQRERDFLKKAKRFFQAPSSKSSRS